MGYDTYGIRAKVETLRLVWAQNESYIFCLGTDDRVLFEITGDQQVRIDLRNRYLEVYRPWIFIY